MRRSEYVEGSAPKFRVTGADGADGAGGVDRDPAVLPDEDTFVLPAAWQRSLNPRRGGVVRTPTRAQQRNLDAVEARTAEEKAWIQEFLDAPGSDAKLVDLTRLHLVEAVIHRRARRPWPPSSASSRRTPVPGPTAGYGWADSRSRPVPWWSCS